MKIKKGDTVLVIAGKDKGKTGKVISVNPKDSSVKISGINIGKKHIKPKGAKSGGGITEVIMPLAISKVMFMCKHCQKPARVGYNFTTSGDKERICKVCKSSI
ncbi:MAG: 50S ribosomal protein L24 [Patescibacteria group bacterium]|nr:50S ribosomal protein L24 [Patescibacteria group bacterium]